MVKCDVHTQSSAWGWHVGKAAMPRPCTPALQFPPPQGFRVVLAEDCWMKSLVPLMGEVRQQMGGRPVYISFDIDGLDPAYAPGTGTPEIAGLTPSQVRRLHQRPFLGGRIFNSLLFWSL